MISDLKEKSDGVQTSTITSTEKEKSDGVQTSTITSTESSKALSESVTKSKPKIDMENTIDKNIIEEYQVFVKNFKKTIEILKTKEVEDQSTPHEVIKENRHFRLLHYVPLVPKPIKTPILIVYALINKSYILDLQADKSWIRYLLTQGFDIYLIDWKSPSYIDKFITLNDYINYFIDDCVNIVRKRSSVEKITLHGYCMGSTLSAIYTSLYPDKIKNLITLAPVFDTEKDDSIIGIFSKKIDVDKVVEVVGNLPVEYLFACFQASKPFKQGIDKYINLVNRINDNKFVENFLRVEKWLYDTPAVPGETFRQWVFEIYQKNLLVNDKIIIGDKRIELSKIKVPVLNVIAEQDHIVSPGCSLALNDKISSTDKTAMTFPTGHVGLIASSYSQKNVLPKVSEWLKKRS